MSEPIAVTSDEFTEIKRKLRASMEASLKKKLLRYKVSDDPIDDSSFSSSDDDNEPVSKPDLLSRASVVLPSPSIKEKLVPQKKTRIRRAPTKEITLSDGTVKTYTSEGSALLCTCLSKTYSNYKLAVPSPERITWNEFRKRFSPFWLATPVSDRQSCSTTGLQLDWSKFKKDSEP